VFAFPGICSYNGIRIDLKTFLMPILQFRCHDCSSVFEYFLNALTSFEQLDCLSCGGANFSRMQETCFYPNKNFCPHDKELDSTHLKEVFSSIMTDNSQKCGGCGTDGAPGKCKSGGGGCGSGNCACKSKAEPKKLSTFVTRSL